MFENSSWIWLNECTQQNVYVDFYDSFTAKKDRENLRLLISADSQYAVYVNGEYLPARQFADYYDQKVYDELDLKEYVKAGVNSLKITGYCLNTDTSTYRTAQIGKPSGALIYEVRSKDALLTESNGETKAVLNTAYKNEGTERVTGQLGFSFCYDIKNEGKTDGIRGADIVDREKPVMKRPVKQLITGERIKSVLTNFSVYNEDAEHSQTTGMRMEYAAKAMRSFPKPTVFPSTGAEFVRENGYGGIALTVDLGREEAGTVDFDLDLSEDAEILIGWGEHLEDMCVRAYVGGRNFCASYKGKKGKNAFRHPFLRMGCRYITLFIAASDVKVRYIGLRPTDYPVSDIPYFESDSFLYNKIYKTSLRTLLLCMHEHYEDCPWREQALYTMDSRNQMLCGYYAFGEYDFPKASLRLAAQSLRKDGMLELCSPARCSITIPSFSAVFPVQLYEYALYSGDLEFLAEMLPVGDEIAEGFIAHTDTNGVLPCYKESPYWNFYEWKPGLSGIIGGETKDDDITFDAPLAAFVSLCYGALEKAYGLIGDVRNALKYSELRCAINAAADKLFWDEEKGAYYTYINRKTGEKSHLCELTQSLMLCCGAATKDRAEKLKKLLTSDNNGLIPVTIAYSIFKYEALVTDSRYSRYVFGDIEKLWGHMLFNNATTFWETIAGAADFGDAGSLCHGWSAIPVYFLFRYALGILPGGGTEKPVDSGLTGLKGKVLLPNGKTEKVSL